MRPVPAGSVCLDGVLMPASEARVSPFDHGFLYGDGIFETLRTYGGAPFRLDAHLARLRRSVDALAFQGVPSDEELRDRVYRTLAYAALPDATLRISVTRGIGARGIDARHCAHPTVLVAALPLKEYPAALYETGASAVVLWARATHDRPPLWVKTTSYQRTVLARAQVAELGADEGLYLDEDGCLTEGTVSNVFAITADGALLTPPVDRCLPGITRAEVLSIASDMGLDVREAPLAREQLLAASEAFVTSSLAEILPLVALDGARIGEGRPGPRAAELRLRYRERAYEGAAPAGRGA